MKKKKKKINIEGKLYRFYSFVIILFIILILICKTSIAQINLEVQDMEKKVKTQKDINTGLVMKINEMASLANIEEVSSENGLSYNSDNIVTVD